MMATKSMNFKLDESQVADMKSIASVFNMTVTDIVKEALCDYLLKMKADPFYLLTTNVEDADEQEAAEILEEIEKLSPDDLKIVKSETIVRRK